MLKRDRDVEAYSGVSYNDMEMDGQEVPFLIANTGAPVAPPILTGHAVDGSHQVVLGAATMAQLHKRLGQYITVSYGTAADAPVYLPPTRLLVVGTATFPAIGFASTVSDHTSMGSGALLSFQMLPLRSRRHSTAPRTPHWTGPTSPWSGSAPVCPPRRRSPIWSAS